MIVGRIAMAGLLAALAAGCAGPRDGSAPSAAGREPVAIDSGTTSPPSPGRAPAASGSVTGARLPAVPIPRPPRRAVESGPAGDHPRETPPASEPAIAAQGLEASAEPANDGPGREAASTAGDAADKARHAVGVGASMDEPGGGSAADRDVLAMLRDRSGPGRSIPRGGSDSPGRAFSRSTIDDCTVIRRLGDAVAVSRSRGAPESEAVRDGVDRLVDDFGLPRDQRTKFTSRVYGILVYRLEATHTAQALASYAHSVCRVYRDTNQIIPVDEASERAINDRLRSCDGTTAVREELEDCILQGLLEIVAGAS